MHKNISKTDPKSKFIGETLDKIYVKYLDLSIYDDDEDVIEDENSEITEIKNVAFVFGDKAIIVNCLDTEDNPDELTIAYTKWENDTDGWTDIQDKILTKYIGKKLIFMWYGLDYAFTDEPLDMCAFSFQTYPDILIYSICSHLKIFESHQVPIPPKSS